MEILRKNGIKNNSNRRHIPEQKREQRRAEAAQRQTKYDALSLDQKLARHKPGGKAHAKLLAKKNG